MLTRRSGARAKDRPCAPDRLVIEFSVVRAVVSWVCWLGSARISNVPNTTGDLCPAASPVITGPQWHRSARCDAAVACGAVGATSASYSLLLPSSEAKPTRSAGPPSGPSTGSGAAALGYSALPTTVRGRAVRRLELPSRRGAFPKISARRRARRPGLRSCPSQHLEVHHDRPRSCTRVHTTGAGAQSRIAVRPGSAGLLLALLRWTSAALYRHGRCPSGSVRPCRALRPNPRP